MSDLRAGTPPPPELDDVLVQEAAGILGAAVDHIEVLAHNPLNAVTGGIWRVTAADRSLVVKILTDGSRHEGPDWWAASDDDRHWNSWRREVHAYSADVARWFRKDGIDAPALRRLDADTGGSVVLWLEDVQGRTGNALTGGDVVDLAGRLGRAQGHAATEGGWDQPWLSHGFLRAYSGSKPVDVDLLDDDAAWAHPRVARHLGPLRDDLRRLHHDRDGLLALAEACPRTLCHLDVWPANVLARRGGGFALVDWSFCGDGALGEDLANLVPDSVFDLLLPHDELTTDGGRRRDAPISTVCAQVAGMVTSAGCVSGSAPRR